MYIKCFNEIMECCKSSSHSFTAIILFFFSRDKKRERERESWRCFNTINMRARRLKGWIIQSWDGNNSDEIKLINLDIEVDVWFCTFATSSGGNLHCHFSLKITFKSSIKLPYYYYYYFPLIPSSFSVEVHIHLTSGMNCKFAYHIGGKCTFTSLMLFSLFSHPRFFLRKLKVKKG